MTDKSLATGFLYFSTGIFSCDHNHPALDRWPQDPLSAWAITEGLFIICLCVCVCVSMSYLKTGAPTHLFLYPESQPRSQCSVISMSNEGIKKCEFELMTSSASLIPNSKTLPLWNRNIVNAVSYGICVFCYKHITYFSTHRRCSTDIWCGVREL